MCVGSCNSTICIFEYVYRNSSCRRAELIFRRSTGWFAARNPVRINSWLNWRWTFLLLDVAFATWCSCRWFRRKSVRRRPLKRIAVVTDEKKIGKNPAVQWMHWTFIQVWLQNWSWFLQTNLTKSVHCTCWNHLFIDDGRRKVDSSCTKRPFSALDSSDVLNC